VNGPHQVTLLLPLPPSTNHLYVRRRDGRVTLAPRVRAYREQVWASLVGQVPSIPAMARLAITLDLAVDHWTRLDLDNALKLVIDAVCDCLRVNDAYLTKIEATKRVDPGNEGVHVTISWDGR